MPLHFMALFSPPEKRYAGYIFDCDGTLADSMPIHYRAWADTVEMHGGHFPEDLFYSLGGVPSAKIVEILNDKFGTNLEPELIAAEKEHLYVKRIAETRPIREVADFAREVALHAKVSVASLSLIHI